MHKALYTAMMLFISTKAFAEIKTNISYDLGLQLAPVASPESGYEGIKFRYGFDLGILLFNNQSPALTSYPIKLLRIGVGQIDNQLIISIAPLSAPIHKQLYLTPSIGLGKAPYTLVGITYTILD